MANWWEEGATPVQPTGSPGGSWWTQGATPTSSAPEDDFFAQARRGSGPGASEQEIREAAARLKAARQPAPAPPPPTPEPKPPDRSLPELFGRGLMMIPQGVNKSLAGTIGGLGDLGNAAYHAIGQSDLPPGHFSRMAEKLLVGEPGSPRRLTPETTVERGIEGASQGATDAATMAMGGEGLAALRGLPWVGRGAETVGDFARAAPVMQLTSGAAGGGASEATGNPAYGTAAALAVPGLATAGQRVIRPIQNQRTPEGRALVQDADRMGIPLSPGERNDSTFLQIIDDVTQRLPLTSGPQKAIKQEQQRAFNRASLEASHTPGDIASPDVLSRRFSDLGDARNDIADRNALNLNLQVPNSAAPPVAPGQPQPTTGLFNEIVNYNNQVRRGGLTDAADAVAAQARELFKHIQPNTTGNATTITVDGPLYRQWDTQIREAIDRASNGDVKNSLRGLRTMVQDGMGQSMSPQDAANWRQINRDFANLYVTTDGAAGAGAKAAEGNVPPKALRQAVIQSVGEVPYALGAGDQNRQARIGQDILREPVGESGTSIKEYAIKLLTGAPITAGATTGYMAGGGGGAAVGAGLGLVLPRIIQAGMNSPAGQAYLSQGIPGLRNLVPDNPSSMTGNMTRALAARLMDEHQRQQLGQAFGLSK